MKKKNTSVVFYTIWIFIIFLLVITHQGLPLKWLHLNYHSWPNIAIFGYCFFFNIITLLLILFGFKKGKETFLKGISIFLFYLLTSTYQSFPLELFGIDYKNWPSGAMIGYSLIYEFLIILSILWIYRKELSPQFKEYKNNFKKYISSYIKYWFIALGLMMVSNLIIKPFTSDIAKNEEQVRVLINVLPLYTFIVSVIFAPII